MKLQKALAVIGAGVLLFAASDAIAYAATGSSLVLGKINAANATTTIQNTGTTPALKLLTASNLSAPMAVNGKGKVVNLYADRAATADNASKLGGQTITQVRAGINAATLGGKTAAEITAAATSHTSWGTVINGALQATSGDVSVTHTNPGQFCINVAGLDLSSLTNASVVVTPRWDNDNTAYGPSAVTTDVEVLTDPGSTCAAGGFRVFTLNLRQATGDLVFADNGFEFTVMH